MHFLTEFSQVYARTKFFVMGSWIIHTIDFAKTNKFHMTNFFDERATLKELNEHTLQSLTGPVEGQNRVFPV